mmetsp:Transcript_107826/g.305021  ORF Transcript_107826/g.305021 Transcript_107826/m.305021 type:complete len:238 (-) Transcript_107826:839-1552(-)
MFAPGPCPWADPGRTACADGTGNHEPRHAHRLAGLAVLHTAHAASRPPFVKVHDGQLQAFCTLARGPGPAGAPRPGCSATGMSGGRKLSSESSADSPKGIERRELHGDGGGSGLPIGFRAAARGSGNCCPILRRGSLSRVIRSILVPLHSSSSACGSPRAPLTSMMRSPSPTGGPAPCSFHCPKRPPVMPTMRNVPLSQISMSIPSFSPADLSMAMVYSSSSMGARWSDCLAVGAGC